MKILRLDLICWSLPCTARNTDNPASQALFSKQKKGPRWGAQELLWAAARRCLSQALPREGAGSHIAFNHFDVHFD